MKSNILKPFMVILVLGITLLTSLSCSKTQDATPAATPSPTVLQFKVVDAIGNAINGATVDLYNNQSDYDNSANKVSTQTTDNSGNATFNNVQANTYYYDIYRKSDCQTNALGGISTSSPLSANKTNNLNVVCTQVGSIQFNNSSSNPYHIYVGGTLVKDLDGGSSFRYVNKIGSYDVEVKQISGYAIYPTDEKGTYSITACGTTNINFP